MNRVIEINESEIINDLIYSCVPPERIPFEEISLLHQHHILSTENYIVLRNIFRDNKVDDLQKIIMFGYEGIIYNGQDDIFEISDDIELAFELLKNAITETAEYYLKNITYSVFLDTWYWKIISAYKKHISGNVCAMCCSQKRLNTHHRKYENRGVEYKNLDDLIVVCNTCHSKHHGKGRP